MSAPLTVAQLTVGPLEENCWLLTDRDSRSAVLIDPGDEAERLLRAVEDSECELKAIWLTHAHFDHIGAVAEVIRKRPVPVFMHPLDAPFYENAAQHARAWGLDVETPTTPITALAEGDLMTLGPTSFGVWHVPGHAPGHVAFIGGDLCISGDVLFAGSIGRTDLPLCDPSAMHRSLERLATLPGNTRVLPGHGNATTVARERAGNPFLSGLARPVGA